MLRTIRSQTNPRQVTRINRKARIKKKIARHRGEVPRLIVYRSNRFLYAQVLDDLAQKVLCQANTREKEFSGLKYKANIEAGATLGKLIGERAKAANVERILFDRNGYDYHGRIKAVAEGAREAGLVF